MKRFEQTIQVEIPVDAIAVKLLENFAEDSAHAELIVENIIGRLLAHDKGGLGMLFNSLNGYKQEINFEVGDKVVVPDLTAYGYWDGPKSGRSSKNIEVATIVEINEYSDYKLLVEYSYPSIKDEDAKQISQVSHVGVTLYVEPATKSRPESKEIYFDESFNETSI